VRSTKGEQTRAVIAEEYYARNQAEHAAACRPVLDTETRLGPRLRGVLRALIDEKTYRLIDSTAPLAERLIRLARLPGLRSLTRRLLRVADDVLY
jgi:hypothetical protein